MEEKIKKIQIGHYLIIDIDKIKPNNYNIKSNYNQTNNGRLSFEKIKRSINIHGQMNSIKVREISNDLYEIIDGYCIWMAMKELGFKEIEIKNFGNISEEESIKKYLYLEELKIPLDIIEVAWLLKRIKEPNIKLKGFPYSEQEIKNKIKLIEFDWDKFKEIEEIENKQLGLLGDFSRNQEPEKEIEEELEEKTEEEFKEESEKPAFEEKDNKMQTKSLGSIKDEDIDDSTGVNPLI